MSNEKKIEKLSHPDTTSNRELFLKINEIIDHLNGTGIEPKPDQKIKDLMDENKKLM